MAEKKYQRYAGKVRSDFYTTRDEREHLKSAATGEGLSYAAFCHVAAVERARRRAVFRQKDFRALADIHNQIRKAGVNLNQMLHVLYLLEDGTTTRRPLAEDVRQSCDEISSAIAALRKFIADNSASV